jgi:uncharacterized membrane protein YedE/YeeE
MLLKLGAGLLGGAIIGAAASLFWARNGRVAGISGLLRAALLPDDGRGEAVWFVVGLAAVGLAARFIGSPAAANARSLGVLVAAGLLVGFGTRLGGGCTSGHGVCGISRFALRSLVATITFVGCGALAVVATAYLSRGGQP